MRCPSCKNPLPYSDSELCECGWKASIRTNKRAPLYSDGPRDVTAFLNTSYRFKMRWAERAGMFRDDNRHED